jgi:hypothetical protein
MDEALAVRLYSGPAFQPINTFLRQLAALSGEHRVALARHPGLSFAATCRHLSAAVRKLAAVATEEELARPLYRGVRGELRANFWLPGGPWSLLPLLSPPPPPPPSVCQMRRRGSTSPP